MSLLPLIAEARQVLENYGYRRRSRSARQPPPGVDVVYSVNGYYDEPNRYKIARHLTSHDVVKVWDPSNTLLKLDVGKWLINQLSGGFAAEWENAEEWNADEDDPKRRAANFKRAKSAMAALKEWEKAKAIIKRGKDKVVTIKLSPSYQALWKKHGL